MYTNGGEGFKIEGHGNGTLQNGWTGSSPARTGWTGGPGGPGGPGGRVVATPRLRKTKTTFPTHNALQKDRVVQQALHGGRIHHLLHNLRVLEEMLLQHTQRVRHVAELLLLLLASGRAETRRLHHRDLGLVLDAWGGGYVVQVRFVGPLGAILSDQSLNIA